ncbi:MAG: hypothetical protein JSW16_03410, partial [Dehalococcoidales bacterium]
PKGKPAAMLAEKDISILPTESDEGNVDRYILSNRLAVERRTGSSFLRGIVDKTLFTSAIYLREHFEIPIFIIEGEVNYEYTAFNPQAIRGALSSMTIVYGVSIISTPSVEETVALIAMMALQEQAGVPAISLIPKRKATDLPDMQRRIIEMLPGCGMTMARDLLQHFGSIRQIMNATEAELHNVPGIGTKKASGIYEVINAEYESVDTEKQFEEAIVAAPELLFDQPVTILERQHYMFTEHGERNFIDLVFLDPESTDLFLVELKRDRITREHEVQLRRYLDGALHSHILRPLIQKGNEIHGILATIEDCEFKPRAPDITVRIVDKERTIQVLKQLRNSRY